MERDVEGRGQGQVLKGPQDPQGRGRNVNAWGGATGPAGVRRRATEL